MTRPRYERPLDVAAENEIIALAAPALVPVKLGPYDPLDFALYKNNALVLFAEVKNRPGLPWKYRDGYYLSKQKVWRALAFAQRSSVPPILIVRFKGQEIAFVSLEKSTHDVVAGRTDRNDPRDVEVERVFPWTEFRLI